MARLIRMDKTGHTTLAEWTTEDPASVEAAVTAASTDAGSSVVHSASVVCPVLSMRMSLAMEAWYAGGRRRQAVMARPE